jgi:enoyl-CoA hydratase/carnithine racemase
MRMATSGEPVDAAEAYRLGLVHAVVPRSALLDTAREWAGRLAALDPAVVRATKRAVNEGLDLTVAEGLALERRLAAAVQ